MHKDENIFETTIKEIFKRELERPFQFDIQYQKSINNALNTKKRNKFNTLFKIIAVSCCSLSLTTGIVWGAHTIYEKIWKKPTSIITTKETFEVFENPSVELFENELEEFITTDDAINRAQEIMKKYFGEIKPIKQVSLIKESNKVDSYYVLSTSENQNTGIYIKIKAIDGKFINYTNLDLDKYNQDIITKEEAAQRAQNIYLQI